MISGQIPYRLPESEKQKNYPIDRYGVNRLTSSNGPTIGAYEFVQEETEDSNE